jgi:RNA polymerase sigma-54 factor
MTDVSFHQTLGQQQSLTPQMRRSLEILQANSMELSQLIYQAMEINPVLEMEESMPVSSLDDLQGDDSSYGEEGPGFLNDTADDWRDRSIMERPRDSGDDEQRRQHLYDSIVGPETLQQFLTEQVHQSMVPREIQDLTILLIGNLNERGFHDEAPSKIASRMGISQKWMDQAIRLLKSFDPSGIGAANLQESLLLQLARDGREGTVEYRMVEHHLEELARRHFSQIARALGTTEERVEEAAQCISGLDPDPGGSFAPSLNPHVTPDVIVVRGEDGSYEAELTNDHIPRLRINDFYKSLLAQTGSDKKTLEYLRENIRDGRALIGSISMRQETLLAIAQVIVKKQEEFLLHGASKLRPMTMVEVGDALGMHATTVSRAVSGKYVATPSGMRELRSFFTSGYQMNDGADLSNSAVRHEIQRLIAEENLKKPLSDKVITEVLQSRGIDIQRRTVAKYREQLHILPSHLRKRSE